jgi:1-aminocyclopropane-1-carboxylate deaminase/D-cysteine desulfhydrase-like pyridoxal-dependent ACC family enzyme
VDSKLTLKLDQLIIEQAENYAKVNNISLSKLVENYLRTLTLERKQSIEISELVESLTGVVKLPETSKMDYLVRKHK